MVPEIPGSARASRSPSVAGSYFEPKGRKALLGSSGSGGTTDSDNMTMRVRRGQPKCKRRRRRRRRREQRGQRKRKTSSQLCSRSNAKTSERPVRPSATVTTKEPLGRQLVRMALGPLGPRDGGMAGWREGGGHDSRGCVC
jgi:hypothetical protein